MSGSPPSARVYCAQGALGLQLPEGMSGGMLNGSRVAMLESGCKSSPFNPLTPFPATSHSTKCMTHTQVSSPPPSPPIYRKVGLGLIGMPCDLPPPACSCP